MDGTREREERCYSCGCCWDADGWCPLMGAYGFDVKECTVSDEEKFTHQED